MLFIVPLNSSASTVALTVACPLTRFSHSQLTYSFPVSTGPKFLRLFFYSTSYQNFHRSKAYFSVKAGPYTLLQDFNASLHADAGNDPGDYLFREYCTNLKDGDRLNITFHCKQNISESRFVRFHQWNRDCFNAPFLYYTNPDDVDITGLPQLVGVNISGNKILLDSYIFS
ncbi:hypothetical protein JHK87_051453 [Glycine soja]|nr:hypothetical protein JHK87_051453 [Glycine soja]